MAIRCVSTFDNYNGNHFGSCFFINGHFRNIILTYVLMFLINLVHIVKGRLTWLGIFLLNTSLNTIYTWFSLFQRYLLNQLKWYQTISQVITSLT